MIKIFSTNYLANIFFLFLGLLTSNYAQSNSKFYLNIIINQEYRDNIYRLPDSAKIGDYRLLSSIMVGYEFGNYKDQHFDFHYENRYQRYFHNHKYNRMEHYLNLKGTLFFGENTLNINNTASLRNYKNNQLENYFRNIINVYYNLHFNTKLTGLAGYKNWIKTYPNDGILQDYLSHRFFIKLNYQVDESTNLGIKTEYQWHKGNLYPYSSLFGSNNNLRGSRYQLELFGNKIFGKNLLIDFVYKFESDQPDEINNQFNGEHQGDEETEDLITEDADFDYMKHQITVSFLYKLLPDLSFFSFNVLQNKNFNHWKVNPTNDLRRDLLFYSSNIFKYKLWERWYLKIYLNAELINSNFKYADYNLKTIGIGVQFKF